MNYSQNIANTMIYCRDFYFNNLINVVLQAPLPLKLYYKIVTHVLRDNQNLMNTRKPAYSDHLY